MTNAVDSGPGGGSHNQHALCHNAGALQVGRHDTRHPVAPHVRAAIAGGDDAAAATTAGALCTLQWLSTNVGGGGRVFQLLTFGLKRVARGKSRIKAYVHG